MLGIKARIPRKQKPGSLQPVLPLVPLKLPSVEEDKGKFISFELKTRVGQPENGTKYKKSVRKFEEGSPQEWIDLLKDLEEIWTQNSMSAGQDRASTVRALLGGESETTFNAALQEARTNAEGVEQPLTVDHVKTSLAAVTESIFPHRALEIQRLWMNRRMFKPMDLTTRQTAAAINRLNNALPMFPNGTVASKFSPTELIGLLEWSLPPAWRAKFDLDGYVPTLGTKARLIEACEAIERNEETTKDKSSASDNNNNNNKKHKSGKSKGKGKSSDKSGSAGDEPKFYCTEHGHNQKHDTVDCWTLKNRAKRANGETKTVNKRSFSNKAFRKEINLLAKQSSRAEVVELFDTAIQREKSKLAKKAAKKRKKAPADDSDSDSDESVHILTKVAKTSKPKSILKKKSKKADILDEETEYQKRFQWLQDHGDSIVDEPIKKKAKESEESSSDEE
jgi:hypothetical protein